MNYEEKNTKHCVWNEKIVCNAYKINDQPWTKSD